MDKNESKRAKSKRIKILDKKLGREKAWGQAWQSDFLIEIDPRQRSKKYLNTLIHELLHCLYPESSERKVSRGADFLTKYIWDKDYRRIYK